jgi:peptidoglycan/xylan/chitin deacetylase (PgdA/CDA1 family)
VRRGIHRRQKEDQVKTRLGPEETVAGRNLGAREEVVCSARHGFGAAWGIPRAALTFDDGPDPFWTPRVLDALRRAGVRATFFVVAPLAIEYPRLVSAALQAGHEVEFHCTKHVRHTHRSRSEVEADTREGLRVLRSLGVEPRLWRPPWGVLAPWTQEVAESFGLRLAPWSADTHDWRGDTAPEMLRRVEPFLGPGSVVLMHDALGPGARRSGCEETVALVGDLVTRLRSMGCEPGPLTLPPNVPGDTEGRVIRV